MLSDKSRNFFVGLTMIVALLILGYGITKLQDIHWLSANRPYTIALEVPNSNGVGGGTKVDIKGIPIGQVQTVYLAKDHAGKPVVRVVLQINPDITIPASAHANLGKPSTGIGQPWVTIDYSDDSGPALPKDGSAVLGAEIADTGLIPKSLFDKVDSAFAKVDELEHQFSALANQTTQVVHDMHVLLDYAPPEKLNTGDPADPNRPQENLSTVIIRFDRTIAEINKLVADKELQDNIRVTLKNFADGSGSIRSTLKNIDDWVASATKVTDGFSDTAKKASATLETTQKEVIRVSEQLVSTVAKVESLVASINDAKGTTGKLINDPRLYEGLVDLSKSLRSTVDDLNFMLKKWKDEGVDLHLK